jgi:ligand-binding SRPBCC domain-containing protein
VKIYQLYRSQPLKITPQDAWAFFSSPYNLNDITPDFFHLTVNSRVPETIYSGLMISYTLKAVFGIPLSWLSEISHCDEPKRFVYEQRIGPFKFWSHEVCLHESEHGIILEDIVFYAMPFAWFGQILHKCLIADRLNRIFDTRREKLAQRWR